jgi:hypothetical protein
VVISRRDILSGADTVAGIAGLDSVVASAVGLLSHHGDTESDCDEGSKAGHIMTGVLIQGNRLNEQVLGLLLLVANTAGILYQSS